MTSLGPDAFLGRSQQESSASSKNEKPRTLLDWLTLTQELKMSAEDSLALLTLVGKYIAHKGDDSETASIQVPDYVDYTSDIFQSDPGFLAPSALKLTTPVPTEFPDATTRREREEQRDRVRDTIVAPLAQKLEAKVRSYLDTVSPYMLPGEAMDRRRVLDALKDMVAECGDGLPVPVLTDGSEQEQHMNFSSETSQYYLQGNVEFPFQVYIRYSHEGILSIGAFDRRSSMRDVKLP